MTHTAPSDQDTATAPGPNGRAAGAGAATDPKPWKSTVAEVGSTVADAAVEAVAMVGDAARTLTSRGDGRDVSAHAAARSERRRQKRADARQRRDAAGSQPPGTGAGRPTRSPGRAHGSPTADTTTAGDAAAVAGTTAPTTEPAAAGTSAASSNRVRRRPRSGGAATAGTATRARSRSNAARGTATEGTDARTPGNGAAARDAKPARSRANGASAATRRATAKTNGTSAAHGTASGPAPTAPAGQAPAARRTTPPTAGTAASPAPAEATPPAAKKSAGPSDTPAPAPTTNRAPQPGGGSAVRARDRRRGAATSNGSAAPARPRERDGAGGPASVAAGSATTSARRAGNAPAAPPSDRGRPGGTTQQVAWLPPLRRRRTERPWLLRVSGFALASVAGLAAVLVAAVALLPRALAFAAESTEAELILPSDAAFDPLAQRSKVLYSDGSLLAVLSGEEDRKTISLDRMPDHAWQAIVAAEDQKFFEHEGYDPQGIGRALVANFQAGGVEQGGSTISQQVARMNFKEVGSEQSVERKLKEIVYAIALEERFTKQEILNRYVNQVYFGAGAYGLQAASQEFFRSTVDQIRPHEAALLAGLISSPSAYNPRVNLELAREQRDLVLDSMGDAGYLTDRQVDKFKSRKVKVAGPRRNTNKQPAIIEEVMREFKANPVFGATVQEREDNLFNGGLLIRTTIRPRLQKLAEQTVERNFGSSGPTAAIAAVDPRNGKILAAASSKRFNKQNFNLAIRGRRQPGSAFKPFVMAEALRQGFSPGTTLNSRSPVVINLPYEQWTVQNYGGASYGQMDMAAATKSSVNTYFAQLIQLVGVEKAVKMAENLGISRAGIGERGFYGPAIVLGGLNQGATPLEMASAYGTFANNGVHVEPHLIAKVTRGKTVVFKTEPHKEQALKPAVNATALRLLKGPPSPGGTASNVSYALSPWPVAGKTGTTQQATDAWFVGTTPVMSTAVWVGHKSAQIRMYGATGGGTASPIWTQFMTQALSGRDPRNFPSADEAEFVGRNVNVPNVVGLGEQAALSRLAKKKLIGAVQYQASAAPAGSVIWASPSDDAQIGTTVYIGVSTGSPPPPPEPEPEPEPASSASNSGGGSSGGGGNDDGGGGGNRGNGGGNGNRGGDD